MMMSIVAKPRLSIVLLIALILRISLLLVFGKSIFFYEQTGLIHGSSAYDSYAVNLLDTGIYGREVGIPDANIAPLYSYVLAGVYALVGRGGLQVGIFHTLLDLCSIALVYEIARRLFREGEWLGEPLGKWIGFGAGLFYAGYPYLIFQNLTLIDTPFFMFLMHLFIFAVIRIRDESALKPLVRWILFAGLILGLTTLTRALLPLFAVLVALWFLFRLSLWQTILRLLPVAIISLLVLVPWMIRSYGIYGSFVAVALNTGDNLYQGANPMTVPLFQAGYDAQWSDPPPNAIRGDVYRNNAILTQAGLDYLRQNPQAIPELLWTKFLVHWSVEITPRKNLREGQHFALDEQGELLVLEDPDVEKQDVAVLSQYDDGLFDRVARPIHIFYFGGLLLLAVLGIWLSRHQWRDVSLLWFLQISMTVMYLIFHPSTRYRAPTDPLLFAFSAYAIVWLFKMVMSRYKQIET